LGYLSELGQKEHDYVKYQTIRLAIGIFLAPLLVYVSIDIMIAIISEIIIYFDLPIFYTVPTEDGVTLQYGKTVIYLFIGSGVLIGIYVTRVFRWFIEEDENVSNAKENV
jgi:hypothetical protein